MITTPITKLPEYSNGIDKLHIFKRNDILIDNYKTNLSKLFVNQLNHDFVINFLYNNTKYHVIKTHYLILIKCDFFNGLIDFYDYGIKKIDIVLDRYICPDTLNKFFHLWYNDDNYDESIIKSDTIILDMYYLSKYFLYDGLSMFFENIICKILSNNNWIIYMEYCLNTTRIPYTIISGNERLFCFLIRWLRCFHTDSDNHYSFIDSLCNNVFPGYIENFKLYDILNDIVSFNNNEYTVSFGKTICYKCSAYGNTIFMYKFDGPIQFNETFFIYIVMESDCYNLCIVKHYHNECFKEDNIRENIKYKIDVIAYNFTKETTLINSKTYNLNNICIDYYKFIKLCTISKSDVLYKCKTCNSCNLYSIGIRLNITIL